ncbi:MAG: PilZ domain-containing protein [Candidatus Omnitrophica bacterium]|nr:PilZ domain-containing protein [Candidatus Omnitrophota bacterium]
MPPVDERREYRRKKASFPVRCKKIYGDRFIEKDTLTKNIGEKGACIECDGVLPLNSRLFVEIQLSPLSKTLRALSRIVWIKKLRRENGYELGVEFISLKEGQDSDLSECINLL